MGGLAAAWLTFVAVQTFQYEKQKDVPSLPPPSLYIGSGVVYSLLGLLAIAAPKPAAYLGWAWLLGALVSGQFQTTAARAADSAAVPSAPAGRRGGKAPGLPKGPTAVQGPPPVVAPPIIAPNAAR